MAWCVFVHTGGSHIIEQNIHCIDSKINSKISWMELPKIRKRFQIE